MVDECVKHGEAISGKDVVAEEHVDVFSRDDVRIKKLLMDEIADGGCGWGGLGPIDDVGEVLVVFEGVDLRQEELAVSVRSIPGRKVGAYQMMGRLCG